MTNQDDVERLQAKRICEECVGEEYLKAQIKERGETAQCSYCDRNANSYSMLEMSDCVESAFEQHYRRTSEQQYSDYGRDGEPVVNAIGDAAVIEESPARDIQIILAEKHADYEADKMGEETEFSPESHYEENDVSDHTLQGEWHDFEQSLKTESRFFSSSTHLAEIFHGIDKMFSVDGRRLVAGAGPASEITALYRARVFQSDEKLKLALCYPDKELGSPPMIAAAAGRMNARGISVFYAANEPAAAIAEVRPPVGSRVAVARFDIIRSLRLLDLTALGEAVERGSIFDPAFAARLERAVFLRSLSQRITRPVMPDDEVFEYLATQAVADFLATANDPALDGIAFPSVQAGNALNVVLFHKAAKVETIDHPEGIEIEAYTGHNTEDGWEDDYSVSEQVPPPKPAKPKPLRGFAGIATALASGSWLRGSQDVRSAALRIDLTSIKIHIVRRVQFDCDEHEVRRHRSEKKPLTMSPPADENWDDLL